MAHPVCRRDSPIHIKCSRIFFPMARAAWWWPGKVFRKVFRASAASGFSRMASVFGRTWRGRTVSRGRFASAHHDVGPRIGEPVVTWTQGVQGINRLYFQRIEPDGTRSWSGGGITAQPPIL